MRIVFFIIFISMLSLDNYGQDLIVKSTNDSINCRIDSIGTKRIYLTIFKNQDLLKTTVSKESIIAYNYGFYTRRKAVNDSTRAAIRALKLYPKFRIALSGGLGYQFQKMDENLYEKYKAHLKKLELGYVFGGEFQWYFLKWMGLSLNYQQFFTSTPVDEFAAFQKSNYVGRVILTESITTRYIGLGFSNRIYNNEKNHSLLFGYNLGYFVFENEVNTTYRDEDYKTENLGLNLSFAYEKMLAKNLYLGFKLTSLFGFMKNLEAHGFYYSYTNNMLDSHEGNITLTRLDLTVVVSFSK